MTRPHNKAYNTRKRKPRKIKKDPESQNPVAATQQSNIVLLIYGFNAFCAVSLYSMPYGTMQGGWASLVFLVLHFAAAFASAVQVSEILINFPNNVRTFADMGQQAFGEYGGRVVSVSDFMLIWASSVESVMVANAALVYASPDSLTTYINQKSSLVIVLIWVVVTAFMAFFCYMVNIQTMNTILTGSGAILNIVVFGCLVWLYFFNSPTENKSTQKVVDLKHMPMANAIFALCFAGHTSLPRIHTAMRERNDNRYVQMVSIMFLGSLVLYGFTAYMGYQLFGSGVNSIYVLSMPTEFMASKVAIGAMVIHQFLRYIIGIHEMINYLTHGIVEHRRAWIFFYICLLVIVTIPVTLLAPSYSTLMAFVGSVLGILVSLIIPPACSIRLLWGHMGNFERVIMIAVLVMGILALVTSTGSLFL